MELFVCFVLPEAVNLNKGISTLFCKSASVVSWVGRSWHCLGATDLPRWPSGKASTPKKGESMVQPDFPYFSSDLTLGIQVASLPGAWCHTIIARTGWLGICTVTGKDSKFDPQHLSRGEHLWICRLESSHAWPQTLVCWVATILKANSDIACKAVSEWVNEWACKAVSGWVSEWAGQWVRRCVGWAGGRVVSLVGWLVSCSVK